jgi:hypothetical protein
MPVAEFGDGEKAMVGDGEREVIACDVARMDAMIIQTRTVHSSSALVAAEVLPGDRPSSHVSGPGVGPLQTLFRSGPANPGTQVSPASNTFRH